MKHLILFAIAFASLAVNAQSNSDIVRLQADPCDNVGISETDGFMYTCSQAYTCSDRKNYVFKYSMLSPGRMEKTHVLAVCTREGSATLKSCEDEPGTASVNACWNEAIDKGILRNSKKMAGQSIACAQPDVADSGLSISLNKTGDAYDYQFSRNSFSGGQTLARDRVQVTSLASSQQSCTLTVTSNTTGRTKFSIQFESGNHVGKLIPAHNTGAHVPNISCSVQPDLFRELCAPPTVIQSDVVPQVEDLGAVGATREI
jgi:hypothetical protein